ncbi:zinc-finger domain-containing protein [Coprococcus comes]|nr:zinc-finger domain-containing protein [Coprococcus comes]
MGAGKKSHLTQRQCSICGLRKGKRHGKRVAYHFCYWKCIGGRRTLRTGRTGSKRTGFYRDIDV